MIVTFTRLVLPDADLEAEEAVLVETAKRWALTANPVSPTPEVSVSRSEQFSFVYAGGTRLVGTEMVTDYGIRRMIQLEAKVEVPE